MARLNALGVLDVADVNTVSAELASLEGFKQARWLKPASKDLMQPGPRLARGLAELFQLLHPNVPVP